MTQQESTPFRIGPAPPEHWAEVLGLVMSKLPEPLRSRHQSDTLESFRRGEFSAAGLLEAREPRRGGDLLGAIWTQLQPGRVGNLWPPQMATQPDVYFSPARIAERLIEAAVELSVAGGSRMVQALLETDAGQTADQLRRAGFKPVADLLYLVSRWSTFPTAPPAEQIEFEPISTGPAAEERLAAILEKTYTGSLDCPALNGVRPVAETLAGYRSVGRFDPSRWLLVRHAGQDVGCLLLSEHPERVWELIYMGLAPEFRGRRWGLEITRHAQWLAREGGAARLVVAVDATNGPAIRRYAAAGLATWDKRTAWMLLFE